MPKCMIRLAVILCLLTGTLPLPAGGLRCFALEEPGTERTGPESGPALPSAGTEAADSGALLLQMIVDGEFDGFDQENMLHLRIYSAALPLIAGISEEDLRRFGTAGTRSASEGNDAGENASDENASGGNDPGENDSDGNESGVNQPGENGPGEGDPGGSEAGGHDLSREMLEEKWYAVLADCLLARILYGQTLVSPMSDEEKVLLLFLPQDEEDQEHQEEKEEIRSRMTQDVITRLAEAEALPPGFVAWLIYRS